MSSMSAAQFGPYYHGSNTEFQPGDTLRPPNETGNTYWGDIHPGDKDRVYSVSTGAISTPKGQRRVEEHGLIGMAFSDEPHHLKAERLAWTFATQRVSTEPGRRSAVYRVKPDNPVEPPEGADIPGEVISPSAKVVERIDIAPGRQGTFPQLNWNQFALHTGREAPAIHNYPDEEEPDMVTLDYNHPPDPPKHEGPEYDDDYRGNFLGEPDRKERRLQAQRDVLTHYREADVSPAIQPRLFKL